MSGTAIALVRVSPAGFKNFEEKHFSKLVGKIKNTLLSYIHRDSKINF